MRQSTGASTFKGFDLSNRDYRVTTFECAECPNRCNIRRVLFDGEKPLFYGSRCEKYDVKKKVPSQPDLFAERRTWSTPRSRTSVPDARVSAFRACCT
jgi:hypothetical protein